MQSVAADFKALGFKPVTSAKPNNLSLFLSMLGLEIETFKSPNPLIVSVRYNMPALIS